MTIACESLYKFWGIPIESGPEPSRCEIEINNNAQASINDILKLEVTSALRGDWRDAISQKIFVTRISKEKIDGISLANFQNGKERTPAIVLQGERLVFNFDPEYTINFLLGEKYYRPRQPFYTRLPIHYGRLLPKRLRGFTKRKINFLRGLSEAGAGFPAWPIERSVEFVRAAFLEALRTLRTEEVSPLPFWPENKRFAVAFTHDIDTKEGFKYVEKILELEDRYKIRSTWNLVGEDALKNLQTADIIFQQGHEIALHDYRHDNRLPFLSEQEMRDRFESAQSLIERYNIKGFRSPSLLRTPRMFEVMQAYFSYDSSVSDSEAYLQFARHSGACTVFPFFINSMVEVPITLPLDSILVFMGLGVDDIYRLWMEKIAWIKGVGGLVVATTHLEPHIGATAEMFGLYERLLGALAEDKGAWFATSAEVAEWWRRRMDAQNG